MLYKSFQELSSNQTILELKRSTVIGYLADGATSNQTILELKLGTSDPDLGVDLASNQTILELKQAKSMAYVFPTLLF